MSLEPMSEMEVTIYTIVLYKVSAQILFTSMM